MKCYCCDRILTTAESTRKFKGSGAFTDMCDTCLSTIDADTVEGYHEEDECFDDDGEPIQDNRD